MLTDPSMVRWRGVPGAALEWREWDGEVAVFNQETGSTHLLSDLAGEVLRRLVATERGTTIEALVADLAEDACEPEWTRAIGDVLLGFAQAGLARPESP